ncbi:DUF4349 domain-containing protein [Flavobacterium sp. LMO8]|uniref:DUF4349 domain-containing protein n=1 Tax=Flavobacterium sp. LMO8 TaxID=2654244 RepID=UPI001291385F|nr:DUF4349 domain-containing protein [Flavobacterium sp. LMO8]MQP24360.1 DUF4349 domain-containing protein [Flavobacterium sp. LMO8]
MNKNTKIVLTLLALGIVLSCKESASKENAAYMEEAATDSTIVVSSSAAVENKSSNRKFVRTADVKFKVKNVAKSTYAIEDATTKFGGFVTYTNLQSNIHSEDRTKVSQDSTLVTTKYKVDNNITIRVPNTKMDMVIKTIAKQIHFLDYRIIKADDVSLQMLSNELAQKRSNSSEKRLENAIDSRGKKLNQVVKAEETLDAKKEQNETSKLQNLSLQDQVNFSTITLNIYQDESIKQEMVANEKSINAYRPNIGLQIWDSIKTGWFMLEHIISFVVVLWPFVLIGIFGFIGYKKFLKK